jgi:hypothetical protein
MSYENSPTSPWRIDLRHLSLVPARTVAVSESAEPVAYVPVKLLLAASGRCSCDDCCHEAVRPKGDREAARPARGTDRQPVRNIHLLS